MLLPKEITTVTPLSKTLALILFIALPFIGFLLGLQYQQQLSNSQISNKFIALTPSITQMPKGDAKNWQQFSNFNDSNLPEKFTFNYPAGWRAEKLNIEGIYTVLFKSGNGNNLAEIEVEEVSNSKTLQQYASEYYCHDEKSTCPDLRNEINILIDGFPAKKFIPYGVVNQVESVVKKGSTAIIFTVNLQNENKSSYTDQQLLTIFDHMIQSFRFQRYIQ